MISPDSIVNLQSVQVNLEVIIKASQTARIFDEATLNFCRNSIADAMHIFVQLDEELKLQELENAKCTNESN